MIISKPLLYRLLTIFYNLDVPNRTSMMQTVKDLLVEVEEYVERFYRDTISKDYVYHDFVHVKEVVEAVELIASKYHLSDKEMEVLRLAAWFHDTGYDKGADNHEQRSCQHARAFLMKYNYPEQDLKKVLDCIMATRWPYNPENLLEEILCDADMSHLGSPTYWDRCSRVRQELNLTQKRLMSEREWVDFELNFILGHHYYTEAAREMFEEQKKKHIKQLQKHRQRFYPEEVMENNHSEEEKKGGGKKKKKDKKEKKKKDKKQQSLGRGVETMYRTTYRTHINLSSIADNKANIMLSINAIIISIVVSNLATKLDSNPHLIIPTALLLLVCLSSLVFAILSTRPKITEGKFSREDIENKRANLLFFGNFHNMDLEDFHWGMMKMIKDPDFLYGSMTRDLYYLGIVLAKKYQYLRICYTIFMYGLIVSLIGFVIAFSIQPMQ